MCKENYRLWSEANQPRRDEVARLAVEKQGIGE
jgi:hypothetical protein